MQICPFRAFSARLRQPVSLEVDMETGTAQMRHVHRLHNYMTVASSSAHVSASVSCSAACQSLVWHSRLHVQPLLRWTKRPRLD